MVSFHKHIKMIGLYVFKYKICISYSSLNFSYIMWVYTSFIFYVLWLFNMKNKFNASFVTEQHFLLAWVESSNAFTLVLVLFQVLDYWSGSTNSMSRELKEAVKLAACVLHPPVQSLAKQNKFLDLFLP
jgi:hypothetical protein